MYRELRDTIGKVNAAALCVDLVPAFEAFAPAIFQAAYDHLQASCAHMIYRPAQLAMDLDRHLELLCNLVPPIEYSSGNGLQPATLASIMNVGWAALLTKVDRFPTIRGFAASLPVAARMESLHELLLKAVELAEARQLWEESV